MTIKKLKRKPVIASVVCPGTDNISAPKNIDALMDFINNQLFESNAVKMYLSSTSDLPSTPIDLMILPGGADIIPIGLERLQMSKLYRWLPDSSLNDSKPHVESGRANPYMHYFDRYIVPQLIERGTAIFGICRGMQYLADLFGSKITQHIGESHKDTVKDKLAHAIVHEIPPKEKDRPKIKRTKNGIAVTKADADYIQYFVNSRHHQVVEVPGQDIEVIGWSATSTGAKNSTTINLGRPFYIEEIKHKYLPIAGVQWHPEDLYMLEDNPYSSLYRVTEIVKDLMETRKMFLS